jgi:uncharacterized membrane protein YjgN (DUF898 family)
MNEHGAATPESRNERFSYTGVTSEYFRIWIVSLCLTVLTLGIYSAWAKVRKRRYLYRSTHLAGGSFDYHADPVVILKGRLVAVAALLCYAAAGYFAPGVDALIMLVIVALIPWLIIRSRMFNARYTSYRNLRFRFDPAYREAYTIIFGWYLLAGLTLGLLYPYAHYRRSKMLIDNAHFGNLDFALADVNRGFYGTYIKASLLIVAAILIGLFAGGGAATLLPDGADGEAQAGAVILGVVPMIIAISIAASYIQPAIAKLIFGNTSIGEHDIVCDWSIPRVVFINFTNFIAIALTLGLAIPWATIRLQRYQFENLSVDVRGDIDSIIATQSDEVSAMGEEIGEAFDIDIGL